MARGVAIRLTTVAAVTLTLDVAEIEPAAAVMVVLPAATAVVKPDALIVATAVALDVQVTEEVRSWVEPSDSVPMAWNCAEVPLTSVMLGGSRLIETRVAG